MRAPRTRAERQDRREAAAWAASKVGPSITVRELGRRLARLARWTGDTEPAPFSVAQHSVLVSARVIRQTRDPIAGAYALLHDGHEFATSDIPTDFKALLVRVSCRADFMAHFEDALDAEIFEAVGLAHPMPPALAAVIKDVDVRMAATEARDLEVRGSVPDAQPFPKAIGTPWPWAKAEENFITAWDIIASEAGLPNARGVRP